MVDSLVHIAGVGISTVSTSTAFNEAAVSAGTKALLDAGIRFSDVEHCFVCFLSHELRISPSILRAFGNNTAPIIEVDNASGLYVAAQSVKSGSSKCSIILGMDTAQQINKNQESLIVATVLISEDFLTSHAYLKDSAICIRAHIMQNHTESESGYGSLRAKAARLALDKACYQAQIKPRDVQSSKVLPISASQFSQLFGELDVKQRQDREFPKSMPNFVGTTGHVVLCGMVWQLRGWTPSQHTPGLTNYAHLITGMEGKTSALILCRSDGKEAPKWSDVQNLRDGRERLGYNPAEEIQSVTYEDLESVRSTENTVSRIAIKGLELPKKGGDRAALARL